MGFDWQLGHRTIAAPTEAERHWVEDRLVAGDGYRDMVKDLDFAHDAGLLSDTVYARSLGAVFQWIVSLIYLDGDDNDVPRNE